MVKQFDTKIFTKCSRTRTQIYCHIKYASLNYSHQLCLRIMFLKVQTTQHPLSRERLIVLHKVHMANMSLKLAKLEHFTKVPPLVSKALRLDYPYAADILFNEFHFLFCG